jgi:hypothetical protein
MAELPLDDVLDTGGSWPAPIAEYWPGGASPSLCDAGAQIILFCVTGYWLGLWRFASGGSATCASSIVGTLYWVSGYRAETEDNKLYAFGLG